MTKRSLNTKKKELKKNQKSKKYKFRFSKKSKIPKKNSSKTLTPKTLSTKMTQKHENNSILPKEVNINIEDICENMNFYSGELMNSHFECYAADIVTNLLSKESNENNQVMTEKILNKYNITKKHRKSAFKFLLNSIKWEQVGIKCFFSTLSIFDLFLIKYSEDESNEEECKIFFNSKKTNEFSEKKLILFMFCCFYLSSKYYNTKFSSIEQILQFENMKDEVQIDDLIDLINDIMIYTDAIISNTNLYSYIEVFMIDIIKHMKNLTKNQKFLNYFQYYVCYFSTRLVQDLNQFNILESIKALGIIIFSYDFCKFTFRENDKKLDAYLMEWKENLKYLMKNFDDNHLLYTIKCLNYYVSSKNFRISSFEFQ